MVNNEAITNAESRANIYGFLSRILLQPPDEIMFNTLKDSVVPSFKSYANDEELSKTMNIGINNLIEFFSKIESNIDMSIPFTQMGIDFTFLIRGIKKNNSPLPPYESLYSAEKTLYGERTQIVKHKYSDMGLEIDGVYAGEPPDHLGLELAFMGYLCKMEIENLKSNDKEQLEKIFNAQEIFLTNHLANWPIKFREEVASKDESGFYTAILDLTNGWIEVEISNLIPS